MKLKKLADALSFAHLLGLPTAAAAKAEDDKEKDEEAKAEDDKQRDDESDEDYAKRMEEKDGDEKAEEGDGDDNQDDKDTKGKSKRADDDSDDESARRVERSRCAAIVAFGVKNNCVRQAGVFAFDTNLTAAQAIAAISAGGLDGRKAGSLGARMADTRIPNIGADGGAGAPDPADSTAAAKATAALIIRAGQKRRNEV